jgi:hypothetical protein
MNKIWLGNAKENVKRNTEKEMEKKSRGGS